MPGSLHGCNPRFKQSVIADFPDKTGLLPPQPLHEDFISFLDKPGVRARRGNSPAGHEHRHPGPVLPSCQGRAGGSRHFLFLAFLTFCWVGSQPKRCRLMWGSVSSTCGCVFIPSCFG